MVVAIEILLTAPLRIRNLAALEIDRHLVDAGDKLHLVIPAGEVKNFEPLHFEFTADRAVLLRWHIDRLRRIDQTCRWLFPGKDEHHKAEHTLSAQIEEVLRRRVGVEMNVHLFRHFAAMLYLETHPGDYETIRRVLGHKRLQTTVNSYVGLETLAAARHFDGLVQARRAQVGSSHR
jgi:integrase